MTFQKGKISNPSGRPKGAKGKLTSTFKELLIRTINELESEGKVTLAKFARENPRDFYLIAARLIPTELMGGTENKIIVTIQEPPKKR